MALFKRDDAGRPQAVAPTEKFRGLLASRSGTSAAFLGNKAIGEYVVARWDTPRGVVGLAHLVTDGNGSVDWLVDEVDRLCDGRAHQMYSAVVVAQGRWFDGPELYAMDLSEEGRSPVYTPSWRQLSEVLGVDAPYWQSSLRDREAMLAWTPAAAPAVVPACDPMLHSEHLAVLAAHEPEGSFAAKECLWLVREMRRRATDGALRYLQHIDEERDRGCRGLAVAAVPAPLAWPSPQEPPEIERREGWAQITRRRDILAYAAADVGQMWDSGEFWPVGATVELHPGGCALAAEFAARLQIAPADQPPTVLEHHLLSHHPGHRQILYRDPLTDLPAAEHVREATDPLRVTAASPQRLPTSSPLSAVTFSGEAVWIRTENDQLWLAPQMPGDGISWGYGGGGPSTLAALLARLLDDIAAPAVFSDRGQPPAGLHKLTMSAPMDETTTFTRSRLERALSQ